MLLTTRRLLLANLVFFAFSLVLSVTNVVTVFSAPLRTVSVPSQVGFEGYLADAFGSPLNGTHTLAFRLYDVAANGTALSGWSSNVYANVPVTDGFPLDANGAWRIAVANATVSNVKIVIWGYGL